MDRSAWTSEFVGKPFTELILVIALLLIFIVCNVLYAIFFKDKIHVNHYLFFNSCFLVLIGAVVLFKTGMLVDKFAMSGDAWSVILMLVVGVVFLIHFFYYFNQKK